MGFNPITVRITAGVLLLLGAFLGYMDIGPALGTSFLNVLPFRLGLDLQGGTHLVYRADTSALEGKDVDEAMVGLRDVIERRVNFFGVTEPLIQVERSGDERRLIVELAGVFDSAQAIQIIGRTPFLEFRTERPEAERNVLLEQFKNEKGEIDYSKAPEDLFYLHSDLTGRYLKQASLVFDNSQTGLGAPAVGLQFNDEGAKLFEKMTEENISKTIAIYLDGAPISTPVVQNKITGGQAQITGNFTAEEARDLVRNLNSGALPLPIELISQQNVGPTLGAAALTKGVRAGMYALIAVSIFLLFWYRFPGLIGILSLAFYTVLVLFFFKLFGVTLTTAGIAGFILSVGVAVDGNILIFERMKDEFAHDQNLDNVIQGGFWHAWPSVRDASISTLISSVILFWFGTSIVKGFALTLGIGVLVSMISVFFVSRTFLLALGIKNTRVSAFLYRSGIK